MWLALLLGLWAVGAGPWASEPVYAQQDDDPITQLPKLKRSVKATYPPKAQEEEVETEVILEIDIDAQGLVETARVAQPSPQAG